MKVKNIYKSVCLLGLVAVATTSCEDWLTLYPQDRVVEEDFWEDKNDLEGVRYGAYKQMCECVEKFVIWGDLRSDSYKINPTTHGDQSERNNFEEITMGMPDSAMTYFQWNPVYTTINYCNKVLQHGEQVLERDKQFTTSEWLQMRAEITGLRALNYFYLIRAFKDVPYSTKVINSDAEVEKFPLTNQLAVLDSLIVDCEKVKGQARNRFSSTKDSKGLITNTAIYALLSDMYLWRASLHQGRGMNNDTIKTANGVVAHTVKGDYQLAADYADLSLEALAKQTEDQSNSYGYSMSLKNNYGLTNCDMISNENDFKTVSGFGGDVMPEAPVEIFDTGNSDESIFELQFSAADGRENKVVNKMYGNFNGTHLAVSDEAIGAIYGGSGSDAYKYDSRVWVGSCNKIYGTIGTLAGSYCLKYNCPVVKISTNSDREIKVSPAEYKYSNWIIYRMTDVMLMKAEALACLAKLGVNGGNNNATAKAIVNAIHRRNWCDVKEGNVVTSNDATQPSKYGDAVMPGDDYVKLVMNERQIELIGEGKRWFDLVRYAERNAYNTGDPEDPREASEGHYVGNGQTGMRKMVDDFMKTTYSSLYTTLKNRFKNRYGMYCPIYYMEVKASEGAIDQNPVWNKSKYDN